MRVAWVALALVTAAFTGCVGADDADDPSVETTAGDVAATETAGSGNATGETATGQDALEPVTYEGLEETVVNRVSENGTFAAQDACMLGGCLTGASTRTIDLPAPGPEGVPIHVVAELESEGGTPYLWLDTKDATVYSIEYETTDDGAHHRIEAVVLPGSETMQAVVQWFGYPPATETQYTFDARLMAHHDIAFSGVAVEIPLEPGQALRIEDARGDDPVRFVGYDTDGVEATRQSSEGSVLETTLPQDAEAGEHIILVPPGAPDVHIETNGTDARMVPVTYEVEMGQPHEVPVGEPVEWSFDAAQTPLSVGIWIRHDGLTSWGIGEATAQIDAPDGTVLEVQEDCGPFVCFRGGTFTIFYGSQVADPKLDLGTYSASFEQEATTDVTVGHYTVSFDR